MTRPPPGPSQDSPHVLRTLALLWLTGVTLRVTILALPPVLNEVRAAFDLQGTTVGILTAIPSIFFALAATLGALLINRIGAMPSLLLGLTINGVGAAARGFVDSAWQLQLATSIMCLGVAIMQPVMPTLVRTWTPAHVGLATATYTCGLLCGEVFPFVVPVVSGLPGVGDGWRASLFQWSIPVFLTACVLMLFTPRPGPAKIGSRAWPNWRDPEMWRVGLLIGAINSGYFGLNFFLPGWLAQAGEAGRTHATLLALNVAQIPAALLLMVYLDRVVFRRATYVALGTLLCASSIGAAVLPGAASIVMAAIAGFALAAVLTLGFAMPALLTRAETVPSFSAGAFTISYSIAVAVSIVLGLIADTSASRLIGVLPIALASLVVLVMGTIISSHGRAEEAG